MPFDHAAGRCARAALWLAVTTGCERPDALVLCHNSNCTGALDFERDDTMAALEESLAQKYRGRPLLDGMEIDVFWHGRTSRCLFAHDIQSADGTPAMAAAERVGRHLRETPPPISWNGDRYHVKMELKGHVGESLDDGHTREQAAMHADCALDLLAVLADGASAGGHRLEVIFDSPSPRVLRELVRRPRWPGKQEGEPVELRISVDMPDSTRSSIGNESLAAFTDGIDPDIVEFHAGAVTDGAVQAYRSLDLDFTIWMFSATSENLDGIEQLRPRYILTSEARFMRRWLEY